MNNTNPIRLSVFDKKVFRELANSFDASTVEGRTRIMMARLPANASPELRAQVKREVRRA